MWKTVAIAVVVVILVALALILSVKEERVPVSYRIVEDDKAIDSSINPYMLGKDLVIEYKSSVKPRVEGLDYNILDDRVIIHNYNNEHFRLVFGYSSDIYEFGAITQTQPLELVSSSIDFSHGCSYYKLYYSDSLIYWMYDVATLQKSYVREAVGKFKNLEIDWRINQTYNITIPNCTTICNPYNETITNETNTTTVTIPNCTTTCSPYNEARWQWVYEPIWKSDIKNGSYVNANFTDNLKLHGSDAYKQTVSDGYIMIRFCGDFERQFTNKGWEIALDHIPSFNGIDYSNLTWWNSSWQYRKNIQIQNPTSTTVNNYPIKLILNSSNFDYSKTNYSDIRFTWYNSTSGVEIEIPYWFEVWYFNSTNRTSLTSFPASHTLSIPDNIQKVGSYSNLTVQYNVNGPVNVYVNSNFLGTLPSVANWIIYEFANVSNNWLSSTNTISYSTSGTGTIYVSSLHMPTNNTIVWLNVSSIPASGNATVYMYYNNPNVQSFSSLYGGKNVFPPNGFEDFECTKRDSTASYSDCGWNFIQNPGGSPPTPQACFGVGSNITCEGIWNLKVNPDVDSDTYSRLQKTLTYTAKNLAYSGYGKVCAWNAGTGTTIIIWYNISVSTGGNNYNLLYYFTQGATKTDSAPNYWFLIYSGQILSCDICTQPYVYFNRNITADILSKGLSVGSSITVNSIELGSHTNVPGTGKASKADLMILRDWTIGEPTYSIGAEETAAQVYERSLGISFTQSVSTARSVNMQRELSQYVYLPVQFNRSTTSERYSSISISTVTDFFRTVNYPRGISTSISMLVEFYRKLMPDFCFDLGLKNYIFCVIGGKVYILPIAYK